MQIEKNKSKIFENNKNQSSNFKEHFKDFLSFALETIKAIVISLVIIIPIRYFLIQPFYVKGASMEPTFNNHDYLIVNEIEYRFSSPKRGDIIVFRYPGDKREYFIKRIIGLPNERVKIENNKVFIYNNKFPKGVEINEKYLNEKDIKKNADTTLNGNEYFVLGDNRNNSFDSRFFGTVSKDLIIGKVWLRGWPFNNVKIFKEEMYNLPK
ncbi:MAG: signal peptidase I [Xanthomonadaceae bacterium]|nr:signal peptidase I [Rhodospirillaceae bacterium]NIA17959.1 signal peptidase I [Xanthomonadaceae bacterium]